MAVVVIYADNLPRGMSFQQVRATGQQGVDWADPGTYAKQNGAVGVIMPHNANHDGQLGSNPPPA